MTFKNGHFSRDVIMQWLLMMLMMTTILYCQHKHHQQPLWHVAYCGASNCLPFVHHSVDFVYIILYKSTKNQFSELYMATWLDIFLTLKFLQLLKCWM